MGEITKRKVLSNLGSDIHNNCFTAINQLLSAQYNDIQNVHSVVIYVATGGCDVPRKQGLFGGW